MAFLCFRIAQIPDITLHKYQSLSNKGIEGVLKRHSDFLRQWHGIGVTSNISFHLLYCFDNYQERGKRLSLYFFVQASDENTLALIKPLVYKNPLSDFYDFVECDFPMISFKVGATLIKDEHVAEIYNSLTDRTDHVHFVPKWEMNGTARLYDLFRTLETMGAAYEDSSYCAYRIDLYPVSLVQETISKFSPVIRSLQGDNDIKIVSDFLENKNDNYVQTVKRTYEEWMSNIQTSPHFRVNMFAFADNAFAAKMILNSAASEAISEGNFILANIKPDSNGKYDVFSRLGVEPETYCQNKELAVLPDWSTTYLLNEVEAFFRFPALYDGESIELPKETSPKQLGEGIRIGIDNNGYVVNFPIKLLPKHAFFTGTPGSGKTNTMLHIINQLKSNNIPFLILEPAKKEYRELISQKNMDDVYLFSPHLQSYFPLRINPFEFPKGVRLSDHIEAILGVFQGSFLLEGAVYKYLSTSIEKAYEAQEWDIEETNNGQHEFPTLSDVYNFLVDEIATSSYDKEVQGNITSWLQVRLGSLMERSTGELFDTSVSTLFPEEWLTSSAIVELEALGEQAKNFFVLLVCNYILETLRVNPNGGIDVITGKPMEVRHAIFIEEAHNIIAPSSQQSSSENVDPKISATAFIVKLLAEVRALREAIIIADQLPTALAPEVTKNTGLKLIHRLIAQDDRELIGASVSATPLQLEQVANYSTGQSLLYYEETKKPYEVKVDLWKKPYVNYNIANDSELFFNIFSSRRAIQRGVYSYFFSLFEKEIMPLFSRNESFEQYIPQVYERKCDISYCVAICNDEKKFIGDLNKTIRKFERSQLLFDMSNNFAGLSSSLLVENIYDLVSCCEDHLNYINLCVQGRIDVYTKIINKEG